MSKVYGAFATLGIISSLVAGCGPTDGDKAQAAVVPEAAAAVGARAAMQSGGQQLPPEVGQWVQAGRQDCIDAGGRFSGAADFILRGEFNGDGRTDYLLMGGGLSCSVDLSGREGPRNDFLISQSNGGYGLHGGFPAFEVTDEQIARRNDRDVVVLAGTWFRPGGEVHKILWGWNGSEITVVERQDQNGRAVDEEGRLLRAASPTGPVSTSPLPFRAGVYSQNDACGSRSAPTVAISASQWTTTYPPDEVSDGSEDTCRILSIENSSQRARLTVQCRTLCGNGDEGRCVPDWAPPHSVNVVIQSDTQFSVINSGDFWNGRYRLCRAAAG